MAGKQGRGYGKARTLLLAALTGVLPGSMAYAQASAPLQPAQVTPQALQQMLEKMRSGMSGTPGGPVMPRPMGMQGVPPPAMQQAAPGVSDKPSPAVVAQPAVAAAGAAKLPSMLDDPAKPAGIELSSDKLTVTANNASLSDTLQELARRTGMQIEGANHDQRIFGTYGPASPTDVLTALLDDSGYNVMMVGSGADGAPRRLVLSARTAAPTGQAANTLPARDEEDDEPGATAEPPTQPMGQPGMHTPQQMLEDMQRMRGGGNNNASGEEQQPQPAPPGGNMPVSQPQQ